MFREEATKNGMDMSKAVEDERVKILNEKEENEDGKYILYWMQQSQRAEWNQALEFANKLSQKHGVGSVVAFGLMDDYPEASLRHYNFMLEGLKEVEQQLQKRDIKFVLQKGHPAEVALEYARDAVAVVCDRGYLRHQREWRTKVGEEAGCKVYQVECDVIIPVEEASEKEEYAARTIRKKLHKQLDKFRGKVTEHKPGKGTKNMKIKGEELSDPEDLARKLGAAEEPGVVTRYFKGGTSEARRRFRDFLENSYSNYDEHRNQPQLEDVSHMSPYLHFGQISPLWILHEMKNRRGENREAYIEELLVRRELAVNFCYYNDDYDSLKAIPEWAQETLEKHKNDDREKVYSLKELENAETEDEYWNAAMRMMKERGYLHNHMRMYWGKQILLYTNTPQYAHKVALTLNNKYFLDGRDCNSYTNIAWLFGNHDRGWTEREVFGKVRSMTRSGLERKIDTEAYLEKVEQMLED